MDMMRKLLFAILLTATFAVPCQAARSAQASQKSKETPSYLTVLEWIAEGLYSRAIPALEDMITSSPQESSLYLKLADIYRIQKKYPKSKKYYQQALTIDSRLAEPYNSLASIEMAKKDYKAALRYLEEYQDRLHEPHPPTLLLMGNLYHYVGEAAKALQAYRDYLKFNPEDNQTRVELLKLYLVDKNFAAGLRAAQDGLENDADNLQLLTYAGIFSFSLSKIPEAKSYFNAVLQKDPDQPQILKLLSELTFKTGDIPAALALYQDYLKIHPDDFDANYNVGLLFTILHEDTRAVPFFEKAIAVRSGFLKAYLLLGASYTKIDDNKKALKIYQKAYELEPRSAEINSLYGYTAFMAGDTATARYHLEYAARNQDRSYLTYYVLGTLYLRDDDWQHAMRMFEEAISYNRNFVPALNDLAYVYADHDLFLEQAEDLLRRALATDPDNGAYLDSMGWVQYKLGQYNRALISLTKSHQQMGDHPELLFHLGATHYRLNDFAKALTFFKAAEKSKPSKTYKEWIKKTQDHLELK